MGHSQSSMNPSRGDSHGDRHRRHDGGTSGPTSPSEQDTYTSRNGRGSRRNLVASLVGGGSNHEVLERKETRAEAKARRLERDRIARIEERKRSIREEHVDGGYLVTMGVYIGPEDFNKAIVRQLMIERRVAPFWRGLEDYEKDWTEHQLIAAGRGLPIPAADDVPTEDIAGPHSSDSPHASTQSASYDSSMGLSPSSTVNASATTATSLLRPRSKTLGLKSKESSAADTGPREIQLPKDTKVNGQAIEAFLYKDSVECTICFIWYPPYLNKTRCCDQNICSECFVQIKRPEPHPPEHHDPSQPAATPDPPQNPSESAEWLVSKPAGCPYCTEADFGITYVPPPFRRGLAYAMPPPEIANFSSAKSSSSINSPAMTGPGLAPGEERGRFVPIPPGDFRVTTTDQIRPDWSAKLEAANLQRAKRFAAASALHAAAFVLPSSSSESRPYSFRFPTRNRNANSAEASGSATPPNRGTSSRPATGQASHVRREVQETADGRRTKIEELDDMMMAEAIRLSIVAEEERKNKADKVAAKEAAKQAKKQAKEDKKKEKLERKSVYGASGSSASSSALNLASKLTGRRRGNSNASHLATEVTPEEVEEPVQGKGKGVDRSFSGNQESVTDNGLPGAQHSDPSTSSSLLETHQSIPSPTAPDKPSHLRQMSTASSATSSFVESGNGTNAQASSASIEIPGATETSYEGHEEGNAEAESMFNFRSLTARIESEANNEKGHSADHIENAQEVSSSRHGSRDEDASQAMDESIATIRAPHAPAPLEDAGHANSIPTGLQMPDTNINTNTNTNTNAVTPRLTVTPDTPAVMNSAEEDGKQLGSSFEHKSNAEITQ
ncbi:hypothetical protein DID88_003884 [Monilinia fructigena]|uniref:Protein sip5 n=1 Tax=Monilinia fructigena TaxID=38457 RepID=A0A395IUE0_9HELO|nr:hypothetical protein DID88_003884 [Monilinia fructigena]